MGRFLLEVCCGSVDDVIEAKKGGADRVELNSSIFFGGLTPSIGMIIEARKVLDIPLMVMIRPRSGGFCYTEREMAVMEHDTELAVEYGADGIVFGILHGDGTVDRKRCERIIRRAGNKEVIFHRAFDVTPDPFKALDVLIEIGVKRVLTAGQENTLVEGMDMIRKLVEYASGRIEILPGGGTPDNVLAAVAKTGCSQIHMASFTSRTDTSTASRPEIYFGFALWPPENRYELTNQKVVGIVKEKLAIGG